jgi:type I restriction enzyme S subunit
LGDQLTLLKDGTHGTHKNGDFAFLLSAKNIMQNSLFFDDTDRKISKADFDNIYANYQIQQDDVLLTIVGTIGRVALFPSTSIPIAFQRSVAILRAQPLLSQNFLALELQTQPIQSKLKARSNMSAQAGIYLGDLKKITVSVPQVQEQVKMASMLTDINNLIAATQDKIDILEQISLALKRHLYNHSWSFKDEDEPWIIQTLNNSTSKIKSYSLIRSVETLTNTGYKYIHYGDIHTGKVTLINSVETLPNIPAGNYELLSKGDLILADASEDYKGIADAAILLDTDDQRVVAGLHTIALRPQNTDPVFLYYLFQTEKFKTFARKMGTGLKVFGISYSNLVRFKFASPSKTLEQQRIGNLLLTIENLLRATTTSLKALRSVKQSLLQNLFM